MEKVEKKAKPAEEEASAEATTERDDVRAAAEAEKSAESESVEAAEAEEKIKAADVEISTETLDAEDKDTAAAPKLHVTCTAGVERQLQVLLPDRPLDLQFSVTDSHTLNAEQIPEPLKRYLDDLNAFISAGGDRTRPITPVMVKHNGRTYVVHSSQSVGRSTVPLTHRVFSTDSVEVSASDAPTTPASATESTPTATKERVLDLEGGERTNVCRVEVPIGESDAEWEEFLRTCDRLTCPALPEQAPKAKLDFATPAAMEEGEVKEGEGRS
ncbi:hypothetical protein FB107DRAFT_212031 [Schizophyllum commune]